MISFRILTRQHHIAAVLKNLTSFPVLPINTHTHTHISIYTHIYTHVFVCVLHRRQMV